MNPSEKNIKTTFIILSKHKMESFTILGIVACAYVLILYPFGCCFPSASVFSTYKDCDEENEE